MQFPNIHHEHELAGFAAYSNWLWLEGSGALYPLRKRKLCNRSSILANCPRVSKCPRVSMVFNRATIHAECKTYKAASRHAVPDPHTIASHHVRHHDISRQTIAHNSNLLWPCHSRVWVGSKVGHYFLFATRLLRRVSQYFDTGVGFKQGSFPLVLVRVGSRCVGYYEKF